MRLPRRRRWQEAYKSRCGRTKCGTHYEGSTVKHHVVAPFDARLPCTPRGIAFKPLAQLALVLRTRISSRVAKEPSFSSSFKVTSKASSGAYTCAMKSIVLPTPSQFQMTSEEMRLRRQRFP